MVFLAKETLSQKNRAMELVIIIPVRNEEAIIEKTLCSLEDRLKIEHKVIVVDDYSADDTPKIIEQLTKRYKNIRLIFNAKEQGFGNTLITGFEGVCNNSVVVPFMADSSDQIEDIEAMYNKILKGYDIVCGSRYRKNGARIGGPFLKALCSRFLSSMACLFTNISSTDITNPFKMYRKKVLENIDIESQGFIISTEIVLKAYFAGYKITEIPTIWVEREIGKSKFYLWKDWKDCKKSIKWFLFTVFSKKRC